MACSTLAFWPMTTYWPTKPAITCPYWSMPTPRYRYAGPCLPRPPGRKRSAPPQGRPLITKPMIASAASESAGRALRRPATLTALHEVDDQRQAVEPVARAQPALEEVGVVARDPLARVDLDDEARRVGADLGHVQQLEAVGLFCRRGERPGRPRRGEGLGPGGGGAAAGAG